jgi:hypothetical protein
MGLCNYYFLNDFPASFTHVVHFFFGLALRISLALFIIFFPCAPSCALVILAIFFKI